MARKLNLSMDQGASFTADVQVTDQLGAAVDLTGYTANATMKSWYTSCNTIQFDVSLTNSANGLITISMNSDTTATLMRERYVYDLIVVDTSNNITRVVEGVVLVDPGVSGITTDD